MLKKKINGAWSSLDDVKRKTNGSWTNCTSVKKKYNGSWSQVWGISSVSVFSTTIKNVFSNDNWYIISKPVEDTVTERNYDNFTFYSYGSVTTTSTGSNGGAAYLNIYVNTGETLYIDQKYHLNTTSGVSIYTYAVLFDSVLSSSNTKKALAKASLTTSRQTITLTTTSSASYLYLYLGFTNMYTDYYLPNMKLYVYGIKSDSGHYTF